jgi:hypothetical protein
MTAHRDLEAFLARARQIAQADKSSRVARVAAPDRGNSPAYGSEQAQKSGLAPAIPAIPATREPTQGDWTAEDWAYRFHERAGFLEHDCGLSRHDAEQRALHELQGHWLALHPMPPGTPEGGCVQCKTGAGAPDLLPHVAAGKGHFWIHNRCWPEFENTRYSEALAGLRRIFADGEIKTLLLGIPT